MLLADTEQKVAKAAKAAAAAKCLHCGVPLIGAAARSTGFCCAGCGYVYRLVHEHGLDSYYKIKDEITVPVDPSVFQARDFTWIEELQGQAEASVQAPAVADVTVGIQGISCAGCVWLIERLFRQLPGGRGIVVNAPMGTMRMRWLPGEFSAAAFARKLCAFGYTAGPAGGNTGELESRGLVKRIGLCAAFMMNAMLFSLPVYFGMTPDSEWAGLFALLSLSFGTLSLLVGGTYFISRAARSLRERALHIDLPIAMGIIGAYAGSAFGWAAGRAEYVYFDFVSTFIFLMLVGRWAQVAAVERNRRRLLAGNPAPTAVRLANGKLVGAEQLRAGDQLILNPGQTLPVDARLLAGPVQFTLASINGESEPRIFSVGAVVPSGGIAIGLRAVELAATQDWNRSLLSQLLARGERTATGNRMLERIVQGYVAGIIGVALLAGFGWWLAGAEPLRTGAVVVAILVVSCPCAVALAFPLADEIAVIRARRSGVFVREADLWNRLGRIRTLVFDKTGTLTLEAPVLRNPEALDELAPEPRAALLSLVSENLHPVAQCLLENLVARGSVPGHATGDIRETVGYGISSGRWSLGRPGWRGRDPCHLLDDVDDRADGESDIELANRGEVVARFRTVDALRPNARAEVKALQAAGFELRILSGDRQAKVTHLAEELGLPPGCALGGLSPMEKAAWLDKHGADRALMLGDGANDSLAFDRALCRGTPVIHRGILERKADFYYLGSGIGGLRALFAIDRDRQRTHRAVLVFSVAYNLLAVGLAVAGQMNPLLAAALMPINSLVTLAIVTSQSYRGRK